MLSAITALLLSVSGVLTKNSADCMGLPSDQQLACIREIRAGRSFDVQYPADPFPAAAAPQAEQPAQAPQVQPQQEQAPVQPALVSDLYQRQIVFAAEKQAASTERIAEATERMALLSTIWSTVALLGVAITLITFLPSK